MSKSFGVIVPDEGRSMAAPSQEEGFVSMDGRTKVTPQKILQRIYTMAELNSDNPRPEHQAIGFKCWELLGKHFKLWSDKPQETGRVNIRALIETMRQMAMDNNGEMPLSKEAQLQLNPSDAQ